MMIKNLTLLSSLTAAVGVKCGNKDRSKYEPVTRTYCIALEDMDWDYAQASSEDLYDLTGRFEEEAEYQLNEDKPKLGQYAKRGFLRSYQVKDNGGCKWNQEPLTRENEVRDGILGPTIRGVVGDTIIVKFHNNATIVYVDSVDIVDGDDDEALMIDAIFNLAPTGIEYNHKTAIGFDQFKTYTWTVGESALTGNSSTTVWTYKSDAVEDNGIEKDEYEFGYDSGVFGPIVIVDPAYIMNNDQKRDAFPCDIDEEVNLAFMETSESNSVYYKWNLHDFFDKKYHDKYREEAEYAIPNTKRSINGHMYGNLGASTGMEFDYGSRVRFNVIVQNTTMHWIPSEEEGVEEGEEEVMYDVCGPSQGWTNITVNMGHEMGGSMIHNFDGESTQTLDYHCLMNGTTVMIDVDYFNEFGVSAYFTILDGNGTYVPDDYEYEDDDDDNATDPETEDAAGGSGESTSAGEVVAIVFACGFVAMVVGLMIYARKSIFKTEAYNKCMDDSASEEVQLAGSWQAKSDVV